MLLTAMSKSYKGCSKCNASMFESLLPDYVQCRPECELHFCISFFHVISLLFNIMLPALNKFFEPIIVKTFTLCSKPFLLSSLYINIICAMNSFDIFLKSCKPP